MADECSIEEFLATHAPSEEAAEEEDVVLVHDSSSGRLVTRWAFASGLTRRVVSHASRAASLIDVGAGTGVGLFARLPLAGGQVAVSAAPLACASRGGDH